MCVSGRILSITKLRAEWGPSLFEGLMVTSGRDVIHYYAARSTGELVERSRSRLCGVVIGRHSFANVSGGQTNSIALVGVFDLPENRAPKGPLPAKSTNVADDDDDRPEGMRPRP
jgi:hypothetical protein